MIKLLLILFLASPSLALESYQITLPNGLKVDAEVAKDKEKGLQGRKSLCYNCGMIFIFENEWYHGFWMKGTLINLAIIWINRDGEIVHIIKNAETCLGKRNPYTECPVYSPNSPAKYVLEINPEAASGIEAGMRIKSDPPL